MAYKKVGGLHFFTLGRFGITLYIKKRNHYAGHIADAERAIARAERAALRSARNAALRGELLREVTSHPRSFNPYFER